MFGPNVRADTRGIYYHHREDMFHELLKSLEATFAHKFGLERYEFLFLTGSGTTANEVIIFSFRTKFDFLFDDADFGMRLRKMSAVHDRERYSVSSEPCVAYPLYETSISRLNVHQANPKDLVFLDMVSAFPYYLPPKNCSIFTTVSGKQLGAYPVLGIIGIHKDLDLGDYVGSYDGSSLNLLGHLFHRQKHETLTTPSIPLYYDLLQTIKDFDRKALINRIDRRRKRIAHIVGVQNTIGCGPVITFKNVKRIEHVLRGFNLYKSNAGHQVFLWTGTDDGYESFCRELERAMKDG